MLKVTKRTGKLEDLNVEQIHKMVNFACADLDNVSMSAVVMGAQIQFSEGIRTEDIQNLLIKSAAQLITLKEPNYQYVAARLLLFGLYKSLYPEWVTQGFPDLFTHISGADEVYDFDFLNERYSFREFCHFSDNVIDHSRDYDFTYSGLQQLVDKYLIKNRVTGKIYETPQYMYMLVAMTIFADHPRESRIQKVTECYDAISTFKINLPTPILISCRTSNKTSSSCCLIDTDDSIDGIAITTAQILKATAANMGLGINLGAIRSVGSAVRGGEVVHTGVIPILKTIESAVKATTQSSRGGCFASGTQVYVVHYINVNGTPLRPDEFETYDNNIDLAYEHYNRTQYIHELDILYLELTNIEDVAVSKYVLSWDTDLDKYQINKVLTVWTPNIEPEEQISIQLYNGVKFDTTKSHKFWVYPQGREDCGCWLSAEHIYKGDSLLHIDKELHDIEKVSQSSGYSATYYDLEIENTHCYFVGHGRDYAENNLYLTHNSATVFFPIWNYEIESIIELKNNKGTADSRVKNLDYSIGISKLFYQRFIENKDISLFSTSETPGLYEAFGTPEFDELYVQYENDLNVRRKTVPMQKLFLDIVRERQETGRIYILNVDTANSHSPFLDVVRQSNLCVSPETLVLTEHGYFSIIELEDQYVNVWNGKEYSEVLVKKTGTNQKLLTVTTNSGLSLNCTQYHKWYIMDGYHKSKEVRTVDLLPGDKLIKCFYPVINGDITLDYAYENGFYSGDGCLTPAGKRIYLYHEKRLLKQYFDMSIFKNWYIQENQNREYGHSDLLLYKFFVPLDNYTIDSKLKWFSGLCDSDGTVTKNGDTQSIQISSINYEFLQKIQLMLHTLGIISKVTKASNCGTHMLPANDGTGNNKLYYCNTLYRLLIGQTGIVQLSSLGFITNRLIITDHLPDRECTQYISIQSIEEYSGLSDTYCFTEHKRGMGIFNGIVTGNCMEILQPSRPLIKYSQLE